MPTGRGKKKTVASELELENLGAPIEVRRHPAARRLTLRVSKTKRAVIVTVPAEYRMDEAGKFLRNNIEWVRERLGNVPEPVPFSDGARIPLRGRMHHVCFTGPRSARGVVEIADAAGRVPSLDVSGRLEHAPRRLKDWLVEQARTDLDDVRRAARQEAGREGAQYHVARPDEPLGLMHGRRAAVVFVAAGAGARARARLRRRARGCASRRDEPRPSLLEARRAYDATAG